jgi:hypothetical protein
MRFSIFIILEIHPVAMYQKGKPFLFAWQEQIRGSIFFTCPWRCFATAIPRYRSHLNSKMLGFN